MQNEEGRKEVLEEVPCCCQRLWTSGLKLNNKGFYEVC
jgi:hypothetical protein